MQLERALSNELQQLDYFREGYEDRSCALFPESDETKHVINLLLCGDEWTDRSGKDVPPPDFVCEEHGIMLEVMRVDDHERVGRKGGVVNPARVHESNVAKECAEVLSGLFANEKRTPELFVLGGTQLPTDEDHSYSNYLTAFKRIIDKHAAKSENYRNNHSGSDLVFFVFDESSAYFEAADWVERPLLEGDTVLGRPHFFFADSAFLEVVFSSGADYFVWHTPFKHEHLFAEGLKLPNTIVYDLSKRSCLEAIEYDSSRMVSTEI